MDMEANEIKKILETIKKIKGTPNLNIVLQLRYLVNRQSILPRNTETQRKKQSNTTSFSENTESNDPISIIIGKNTYTLNIKIKKEHYNYVTVDGSLINKLIHFIKGHRVTISDIEYKFIYDFLNHQLGITEKDVNTFINDIYRDYYQSLDFINEIKRVCGKLLQKSLKDIFKIFDIKDTEYVKNAVIDANGLYHNIFYIGPEYKTYTDQYINKNISNQTDVSSLDKQFEYKSTFTIGSIHESKFSKTQYVLCGSFYLNIFRCVIFQQKTDPTQYIVLFCGNFRIVFKNEHLKNINIMYNFIKDTINYDADKKVMLFGHSMGGNVAQFIALNFKNEYPTNNNIYLVSLGIGGNLTKDTKYELENKMKGHFLSFGILLSTDEPMQIKDRKFKFKSNTTKYINGYILPTEKGALSIKSLIIEHNDLIIYNIHNLDELNEYYDNWDAEHNYPHMHKHQTRYSHLINNIFHNNFVGYTE